MSPIAGTHLLPRSDELKTDLTTPPALDVYYRCPAEVWEKIFGYACTDGGYTGRSLSLVSRRMNDCSSLVRYHSISLRGRVQMVGFAEMLLRYPNGGCRRVHHLFIADHKQDYQPWESWDAGNPSVETPLDANTIRWSGLSGVLARARAGSEAAQHELRARKEREVNALVGQILRALAPTLRTLALVLHTEPIRFALVPVCLSALEELTVFQLHALPAAEAQALCFAALPSLRRLHIVASSNDTMLVDVARWAPALTHLRFSELGAFSRFPTYMQALLGLLPKYDGEEELQRIALQFRPLTALPFRPAPLPASVERIVLHCASPSTVGWISFLMEEHAQMVYNLCHIAYADKRRRLAVVANRPPYGFPLETVFKDWLERIVGGDGCWRAYENGLPNLRFGELSPVNEPYIKRRGARLGWR